MARKRPSITLTVSEHEKAQLESLALEFDQTWGDKPNVSKLIKAIANGKLLIAKNHDWSCDRTDTLNQALNLLKDGGYFNEALERFPEDRAVAQRVRARLKAMELKKKSD